MMLDPMSNSFEGSRRLAAAFVRGKALGGCPITLDRALDRLPLEDLTDPDLDEIISAGLSAGLRLHGFKRTAGLPRVARVIGMLRGLGPTSVLDVGSGRGVSLWPLMEALADLKVTAIDRLEHRIDAILAVRRGGLSRLQAALMDATRLDFADASFDGVLALEVFEHIADVHRAIGESVRVARRFVIVSVPSKPDSNPEHIHLLDRARLERSFLAAGALRVHFDAVPGHLIALATVGSPSHGRTPCTRH
jgi:SAM-dependent methyltransferase